MIPAANSRDKNGAGSSTYIIPASPATASQPLDLRVPAEILIPEFKEIKVPAYLMGTNEDFGILDSRLAEVNRVYDAFALRFQGIAGRPYLRLHSLLFTRSIPVFIPPLHVYRKNSKDQTGFEQSVEKRVVEYRQQQGSAQYQPPSQEEWYNARAINDSLHNRVVGLKEIIGVAQEFSLKAEEATTQLMKEKNELQKFAHTAVDKYNKSVDKHSRLSIAYDALLKAASEHQYKDGKHCKVLAKQLEEANTPNLGQHDVGLQAIKKLKSDPSECKKQLAVQEDVTRFSNETHAVANRYNVQWETSYGMLEEDFNRYKERANLEISKLFRLLQQEKNKGREEVQTLLLTMQTMRTRSKTTIPVQATIH